MSVSIHVTIATWRIHNQCFAQFIHMYCASIYHTPHCHTVLYQAHSEVKFGLAHPWFMSGQSQAHPDSGCIWIHHTVVVHTIVVAEPDGCIVSLVHPKEYVDRICELLSCVMKMKTNWCFPLSYTVRTFLHNCCMGV